LQSPALGSPSRSCCFPDITNPLGLGSLCRCCIQVVPDASSWMSILSRFLLQHCPCLVPDTMQEWHGGGGGVICLWATANFFWDPPLPWVHSFSCQWCPMARRQSPYCSFNASKVSTVAFSLDVSWCSDSDSISTEVRYLVTVMVYRRLFVHVSMDVLMASKSTDVSSIFFVSPYEGPVSFGRQMTGCHPSPLTWTRQCSAASSFSRMALTVDLISFPVRSVFTSSCLIRASNNG
jgi:hypothetical protein